MAEEFQGLRSGITLEQENKMLREEIAKLRASHAFFIARGRQSSDGNHSFGRGTDGDGFESKSGRSPSAQLDAFSFLHSENARLLAENGELRTNLLAANSSNEQFRLIADYSPILIALVDPDERYVFMNRLYQKWFGFEPEKAIGKTILEVVGAYAREKVKNHIQSALRGNHVHFENPITLRGGEAKTVDLQFIPVWYPTKNANGFVILGYDITDRKLSESRIIEIQDRLEFALKSAGMSSWHLDVRQNQTIASDLESQLSNVAQIIQERVHPDDAEDALRALKASIQERKPYDHEYRRLQPDGTYRWMSSRATPKFDVNGELISISGVTMDIAERKLSADRYRATTELTPQFIWISDEKGAIIYSNSTLLNYMGVTESEVLADKWVERLHPDDRENTLRVWSESLSKCEPYEIEFRIRAKDGSYGWFLNRALPMRERKNGPVDRWLGVSTNITKLKETEFALTQSEEHFSFLYEASSILSSSLNYNETLARLAEVAVPRLADWCSISLVEESGPKTIALSHPDPAMKKIAEDFRLKYPTDWSSDRGAARVLRTGKPELHEWVSDEMIVASAKDPEHLRLIRALKIRSVMMVPIVSRGETLGVLTLVSSGDHRKYAENDLKIAEEIGKRAGLAIDNARLFTQVERERAKLSLIFSQAPVGIAVLEGPDHVFSMVNSSYCSLFYGGRSDFVGKSVLEAVPEATEQGFIGILNRVYETGQPFVGKEVPLELVQNDGTNRHFYINFVYQPIRDVDQKINRIVAVIQDVTEQVQSRATLETVFQASPAAMVLWKGSELVFDKINPGYQAIFSDRELLGKPFTEALPETKGQPFEEWIKNVFETGEPRVQPEQLAKLVLYSGGPIEDRYFDMSFVRVMGVDNKPFGVYEHAVDVTERVLSRRAMERSKADLETSVRSLEQEREIRERFVATLTHDLRTPLTAAKMSAQLIRRKSAENETLQKLASRVSENLDRADEMIRDLLDANLIRAGESLPMEITACNLTAIARETVDELVTVHGDRFVLIAEASSIEGFWSRSGVRRVLENLCTNAVKYGASDRPISVMLTKSEDWVSVQVHNEGNPISPADQDGLFDPFKRSPSAKIGGQKGWGLGLSLVKGIAEAHGGKVGVESSPERGTTFFVRLPIDARRSNSGA